MVRLARATVASSGERAVSSSCHSETCVAANSLTSAARELLFESDRARPPRYRHPLYELPHTSATSLPGDSCPLAALPAYRERESTATSPWASSRSIPSAQGASVVRSGPPCFACQ